MLQVQGMHGAIAASFVPATMHVHVAEQCVQHRKNMVTASYISAGMQQLHERYDSRGEPGRSGRRAAGTTFRT